jgi:rhodanese-related sulfurtransferase
MNVPTVTVDDVMDPTSGGWVVLDVREPHEWAAGHIEGAIHIPLGDLPARVGELDPQAQTLVVCHVGARSARATAWLHQLGHDVANLAGGMAAWEGAQRPTVRP